VIDPSLQQVKGSQHQGVVLATHESDDEGLGDDLPRWVGWSLLIWHQAHVSHLEIFKDGLKDFEGDSDLGSALKRLNLTEDDTKADELHIDLLPHQVLGTPVSESPRRS
jgi:hypothetical protein